MCDHTYIHQFNFPRDLVCACIVSTTPSRSSSQRDKVFLSILLLTCIHIIYSY